MSSHKKKTPTVTTTPAAAKPPGKPKTPKRADKVLLDGLFQQAIATLVRAQALRPGTDLTEKMEQVIERVGDLRIAANSQLVEDWKRGRKLKALSPEAVYKLEKQARAIAERLAAAKGEDWVDPRQLALPAVDAPVVAAAV